MKTLPLYMKRLKRQLPKAIECYVHQLKEAKNPAALIGREHNDGGKGKRPGTFGGFEVEKPAEHWGEDIALFPGFQPVEPRAPGEANGKLPNLSDLQSSEGNVRDARADVP